MNVFLSHSTKDGGFVEKLAAAMSANGFEPWRCEVDIEKGENFVAKISKGLKESDLTLLVWSPDAANSVWTEEEWTAALKQQVEQSRIRLGLIMLRQHDLPPLLDTKNFIDARSDHDKGIRDTIEWLELRRKAQRFSGLKAPIYLPDYRPEDFVGRSAYLEQLRTALTWQARVFLLYGEPGAGKSTLALRFAWDAQKDFDAVIFQTCGQRPLDAITAELVERLPIDVKTRPPDEQRGSAKARSHEEQSLLLLDEMRSGEVRQLGPDQQRAAARAWLRERQSLLVLDDVWSPDMRQLEPGPNCSVLYTSRQQTLPGIVPKQSIEVEKFTEVEAEELFHTYLDSVFGESDVALNREALLGFAKRVEWLPIAVSVGASMLRERAAAALGRAVPKLRLDALTDGVKDVNALFRTAIASQPEHEQKLLAAGAACVQEGFWLPLAAEIAGLSEDNADNAADRLVHSSLLRVVNREGRRFSLHALLRGQVRAEQKGDGLSKLHERHAATLERRFKDWETRWQECRECLEEIIPTASFLSSQEQHERAWQLSFQGYSLGKRIGELDSALRIMKQEQSFWAEQGDGEAKIKLSASYGNEGRILRRWGQYEEALALHKKEEAICLELNNEEGLAASYGYQARVQHGWGRPEEAMRLLEKQEAIAVELGNKEQLQRSYGNQAMILRRWRQLDEAMALHKKKEAICLELGNRDGLQASYGNQATILQERGRLDEALALLKKQEAICLELGNKSNLGVCYWGWGLLARAQDDRKSEKDKLEQALAIFTKLRMPLQRDAVQAELENRV